MRTKGATAGGDARDPTTTVRRVSIRELPYLRRGETLVASAQGKPEEGGFPGRAYVSEEDPRPSIRLVVRLSSVASECQEFRFKPQGFARMG